MAHASVYESQLHAQIPLRDEEMKLRDNSSSAAEVGFSVLFTHVQKLFIQV
jgi:hypothetical protein